MVPLEQRENADKADLTLNGPGSKLRELPAGGCEKLADLGWARFLRSQQRVLIGAILFVDATFCGVGWVLALCLRVFGFFGEFDPGSGRTLAACLTHASRTLKPVFGWMSGERVSNT